MLKCPSTILGIIALIALPIPGYGQVGQDILEEETAELVSPASHAAVRERLAGNDRYGTAIAVTTKRFKDHSLDKVYIASGDNFPDAISVNSLIAQTGEKNPSTAVLLSPSSGLTPEVLGEVSRLMKSGGRAVLIGGTEALSPKIADQITKLVSDAKVERIAGPTRVETAIEIGNAVHTLGPINEVVITPSDDYRISIVAAALTAKRQAVQLNAPPTSDGKVHPAVQAWIDSVKPKQVTLVGRSSFLSGWNHPNVKRITDERPLTQYTPNCKPAPDCKPIALTQPAGPDQVIAEHLLVSEFADTPHHLLVSRERAVDGIAAGQFAAQQHAAILPVSLTPAESQRYAYILREKGKRAQVTFWAIGGKQAISEEALNTLAETFGG